MASRQGKALLAAIEGYKGGQGGQQEHEQIMSHLDRIHKEAESGHASDHGDSPGKREAGLAAGQRELPSEREHGGGENNTKSNERASFPLGEPEIGDPAKGRWEERKLSATGAVPTQGNRFSQKAGPEARSGATSFRTVAATRAADARMHEPEKMGGGNKTAQTPGPAEDNEKRIGDVAAPAKAGADRNNLETSYEKVPAYVGKEPIGKDQWERAAQGVRKKFAKV